MGDITLLDLLECPLCLERLDVSAKVFPCQHTFCKPCLQQEVLCSPPPQQQQQVQVLCCPECRTPAQASSVGELPENLLLVRLLEGLQQGSIMGPGRGASARQSAAARYSVPNNMPLREGQQQESPPSSQQHKDKQGDSEVVPRALHNHGRGSMGEQVLSTTNNTTNSRQKTEDQSSSGPAPANLLQDVNLIPQSQPLALCRALSDFNPSTLDQEEYKYCLRFLKGDILTVVRRVDEHWIEAKLGDKVGILPLQFTEPNSAAVKLLEGKNRKGRDSSESSLRTGSGSKDKSADAPDRTNHFGVLQFPAKAPTVNPLPPSSQGKQLGVGSSAIYQPANICTFNGLQGPTPHLPTAPANHSLAPASRVTCQHVKGRSDGTHRHQGEKKMSSEPPPTISMALVNPQVTPPSTDSKHSSSTQQLSISVCATLYSYKPRRPEELELRKGEMVGVYGKFKEGWLRGLSLRTGKVGILPGSYVTPVLRTSARLLETKAATTSSPAAVKRPTASRNPAVVLALDRVNTDGTMYSTGQVPSVLNGAHHAAPSAGAEKLSLYGVSQGWDTVRRAFNPHRASTQRGNHYIHTSTSSHLSHSHNFAQVQASGCSPALQRKKHSSILSSPGRPLGRMSDTIAPPSGAMANGRDLTGLKEATYDRKPFPNGPHSILVRPNSHKNNTDKPVKSVRFFTDEDPSPPRLRASSWSGGHHASSSGRPGSLPLEVWAPSLTLGRDGPGIVLKEGKNPVLRKGLETTVPDLNSSLQKSSQTSLPAASAQYSPSRHRVTTTYLAQTDSELSLLQGELVLVHRPRPDGRVLVTQECSGLTGLFHSSVLQAMERLS